MHTVHCVFSLMLSISCLTCSMSVHSCCPYVYHALCLFNHVLDQLSTMHCVCSLRLTICLLCTVSFHSCYPSAVYHAPCLVIYGADMSTMHCVFQSCLRSTASHALCLFTHAVHQLSTLHCVCSVMLPICIPCTVTFHSCYPSAVYHAPCLFTHAAHMSTMHCVCSIMY
jgi:hypothetical protein